MLISTHCENFIFFKKSPPPPPPESFAPENLEGAPLKSFWLCPPEKNPRRKPAGCPKKVTGFPIEMTANIWPRKSDHFFLEN